MNERGVAIQNDDGTLRPYELWTRGGFEEMNPLDNVD
jgi:hypothetical protein